MVIYGIGSPRPSENCTVMFTEVLSDTGGAKMYSFGGQKTVDISNKRVPLRKVVEGKLQIVMSGTDVETKEYVQTYIRLHYIRCGGGGGRGGGRCSLGGRGRMNKLGFLA